MEKHISQINVRLFFRHMRMSWEQHLRQRPMLFGGYSRSIRTNKDLIDALLYSDNFHFQEKQKARYDRLLRRMDESLIVMSAYNAMHCAYQMNQVSRAIGKLRRNKLVILLPDHLRHEWDPNCPYKVKR